MPLVGLAERDFANFVVRLDALDDLLCHGFLPLPSPATTPYHRQVTSVASIEMQRSRTTLRRSAPDEPAKLVEEGIVVREVLPIGPGLCTILHANFYEKAHFVKPTWRPYRG